MVSESSKYMKFVNDECLKLAQALHQVDKNQEARFMAEIELRFGITQGRAKRIIDNLVETGRLARV